LSSSTTTQTQAQGQAQGNTQTQTQTQQQPKKKLTPNEMKERGVVAEVLEGLQGVTLVELANVWVSDPMVLVDPTEAIKTDIKPLQEMYARVIDGLNELSGKKAAAAAAAAATVVPPPSSPGGGSSNSPRPGEKKAPTSAFSRLSLARN
jgi:hypothetical protein